MPMGLLSRMRLRVRTVSARDVSALRRSLICRRSLALARRRRMNVEQRLTELIGPLGGKLHTGRSRNDQVALDFRLYVAESLETWSRLAGELIGVFLARAVEHKETLLPGCTHLQPAQPVSLAQHLLAYAWMLRRDCERMVFSASLRTSSATTANPRPDSPARAASMAAFKASRLV